MILPLLSAAFAATAITFYALLDGFDLGVGSLLLLQVDESERNHMVDAITPTWDGNETWLIMAGVTLLAAFPIAYGILMPAFYVPLIVMLLALGLRGVSFEFRVQMKQHRMRWDRIFSLGSIVAAFMQGAILGGMIQGVSVHNDSYTGGVFDCLKPFPLLCGACVVSGYVVLGACWLHLKTTDKLFQFANRAVKLAILVFLSLFTAVCLVAAYIQPGVRAAWQMHVFSLSAILILMLVSAASLYTGVDGKSPKRAIASSLAMVSLGIVGMVINFYPNIVPFRLSLWEVAASPGSQKFLLIGATFVTPVVLTYTAFAYWVFRGKTPLEGWGGKAE